VFDKTALPVGPSGENTCGMQQTGRVTRWSARHPLLLDGRLSVFGIFEAGSKEGGMAARRFSPKSLKGKLVGADDNRFAAGESSQHRQSRCLLVAIQYGCWPL